MTYSRPAGEAMTRPLAGVTVLDFSTLLPGPLATLMLAEAGARVIKIERPEGEDMRRFAPVRGEVSAPFLSLNGGKEMLALDLKSPAGRERVLALARGADVLVEQFRPGVMTRLGLGWESLRTLNPRLIYCAISGFGQTGARADAAGHDLNYQALSGLLAQHLRQGAPPPPPPALIADIAGGAYPAVMNILLALRQRDATGEGAFLDIAMTDGAAAFSWFGRAQAGFGADLPEGAATLLTGGSPRYQIYATRDGWFLAVGAIEDKFWRVFCDAIALPAAHQEADADPAAAIAAVAAIIAGQDAARWRDLLEPLDCCCTVVRTLAEAHADADLGARAYGRTMARDESGAAAPLAVVPLTPGFRLDAALERPVRAFIPDPD
jgi:crotonobetainyl-CoA:carnitine CoA-transferase CaiB-like acyl-CoA transferase